MIEKLKFEDFEKNPILSPTRDFEARGVFNSTLIVKDNIFYMLYRAVGKDQCTGRIGLAKSKDGIHFIRYSQPIIYPEYDYEKEGCEDPRVVKINKIYWLTYVGNVKKRRGCRVRICLASSPDLIHWKKYGPILMPQRSWDNRQLKVGVILERKINGKFVMYFTGEKSGWRTKIGVAFSNDLIHWREARENPIVLPRRDHYDNYGVETGTNPILVKNGIFMIYGGWGKKGVYKPGGILFSKENPTEILERTEKPILKQRVNWGKRFRCKNHIVPSALVKKNNQFLFYYGAADRVICLAKSPLKT